MTNRMKKKNSKKLFGLFPISCFLLPGSGGQTMILTVLALGGTLLGATTIAGMLMLYQIRQAGDMANSAKAIYAADAGIDLALYQFFNPSTTYSGVSFSSPNTTVTIDCFDEDLSPLPDCRDERTRVMRSLGISGGVGRAFELGL